MTRKILEITVEEKGEEFIVRVAGERAREVVENLAAAHGAACGCPRQRDAKRKKAAKGEAAEAASACCG